MKKRHLIFISFSLLLIIFYFSIDMNRKIDEEVINVLEDKVIRYMEDDIKEMINNPHDFNTFYLLFDNHKLDSKNMEQLFSFFNDYEYHISEIYPYVNPLFLEKLGNIEKISFNSNNLLDIINHFYLGYTNELSKHNLNEEIEKSLVYGIPIRMIKINTSNKAMYEFLKLNNKIKYSLFKYGIFKSY